MNSLGHLHDVEQRRIQRSAQGCVFSAGGVAGVNRRPGCFLEGAS